MEVEELKSKEAEIVINTLNADDYIILLDERGKNVTSEKLANLLQASANEARKNIIFIIGGAFGAGEKLKSRADFILSLSSLVFPHQLVRLIISEQVYRACTILRNEKYHHS